MDNRKAKTIVKLIDNSELDTIVIHLLLANKFGFGSESKMNM